MNHVIVVPKHVDIKLCEDGQLTETCKGVKIYTNWITLYDANNYYSIIWFTSVTDQNEQS
jgi:hypothetical protein